MKLVTNTGTNLVNCDLHGNPVRNASARFDEDTTNEEDMRDAQRLLAASVASVVGKSEALAVASHFKPGGAHALVREFAGIADSEVVAVLVVLLAEETGSRTGGGAS